MTRYVEQVVSLYISMLDRDDTRFSHTEFEKKLRGMNNNFPELLPDSNISANEKRRAFQFHNPNFRAAKTFAEEPVMRIPDAVLSAFEIFAFKVALALFWKHHSVPAGDSIYQNCFWLNFTEQATEQVIAGANKMLPGVQLGERINTDIGNQLSYRYGFHAESQTLIAVMQVRMSGLVIAAFSSYPPKDDFDEWSTVGQRRAELFSRVKGNPSEWW